jgi:hypothetical protein
MVLIDNSPSDKQDQTKPLKPNALPKPSNEPSLPVNEASQMSFAQAFQYAVPQFAEFAIQYAVQGLLMHLIPS